MALVRLSDFLRQTVLRLSGQGSPHDDGQLLSRYVNQGDQAAFGELVRRHGPMVMQVCQRRLRHSQDAEDAFQATFIVLARRAGTVAGGGSSLGGWLHGVAYRTALRAATLRQRQRRPLNVGLEVADDIKGVDAGLERSELFAVLDEEIQGLPEKYRLPLVLFYFEGRSTSEMAAHLGCGVDAAKKRLEYAREKLRHRLGRRGVRLTAATLAALSLPQVSAAVTPALTEATLRIVDLSVKGQAPQATPALALAGEVVSREWPRKSLAAALVLICGGLAATAVWAILGGRMDDSASTSAVVESYGQVHKGVIRAVALSPDKTFLASGGVDGTVKIWNRSTGRLDATLPCGGVQEVAFTPDGKALAARATGVQIWDLIGRKERIRIPVTAMAICFSPDGSKLATLAWGGEVKVWDPGTGEQLAELRWPKQAPLSEGMFSAAFAPDRRTLVVATAFLGLVHWDTATGRVSLNESSPHVSPAALFSDGQVAGMVTYRGHSVQLYDAATRQQRQAIRILDKQTRSDQYVNGVQLSGDGRRMAARVTPGETRIWDVATGRASSVLRGLTALAFSADGKQVVIARSLSASVEDGDCELAVLDVDQLLNNTNAPIAPD